MNRNLRSTFSDIKFYFKTNIHGYNRDESIHSCLIKILYCKLYDELNAIEYEENLSLVEKYDILFDGVKSSYNNLFDVEEVIGLSNENLYFITNNLDNHSILKSDRDLIGDAYEGIIGTSIRGSQGQFFTPKNVIKMMIDKLIPKEGDRVIDPACGSGGFLVNVLTSYDFNIALYGLEKDAYLSEITNKYLSLIGNPENINIYCQNSLSPIYNIELESFDICLTNPPFNKQLVVSDYEILKQFELGYKWLKKDGIWKRTNSLLNKQQVCILFIERCVEFLKINGRMGIILPDGIFGNSSMGYILEFLQNKGTIDGIVSLPTETFQPDTHTKTSVLFFTKGFSNKNDIFMSIVKKVGHDKNGNYIYKDDSLQELDDDLINVANGFYIDKELITNNIFIPEYYNPDIKKELDNLGSSDEYMLSNIEDLISCGIIEINRGNEIGSRNYGSGDIPFIRTSDIVNWEIKFDPIKCVSEDVYEQYKYSQDIQERDILFVNDGTFLIGRTSMVTSLDLKIIIQSHLKKIRVLENDFISPYYLFYLLNSKIVRRQIDSKTFVQATISTVGNRFNEIVLPILKDKNKVSNISSSIKDIINYKVKIKEDIQKIIGDDNEERA